MINDTDRKWFDDLLRSKIRINFNSNPEESLGDKMILYGDFMNPQSDVRMYIHITDMEEVLETLKSYAIQLESVLFLL